MQNGRLSPLQLESAMRILDYLRIEDPLTHADAIFVFGSRRLEAPRFAAQLYKNGMAPRIICLAQGDATFSEFGSEAERFETELMDNGVPKEVIIAKPQANNTLQEALCFKKLIEELSLEVRKVLLVSHPYHQRRAYVTFKKQLTSLQFINAPATVNYEMDGYRIFRYADEIRRLQEYAAKGDIEPQEIPLEVLSAAETIKQYPHP